MSIHKILIVDDDSDTVEMLKIALGQEGYRVRTATNAKDGVALARTCSPDLVLVDLVLPDFNGYTVVERLRRRSATKAIPVVMMTAMPGELPQLAAAEAGADVYIRKPFQLPTLLSAIAASLRSRTRNPGVQSEAAFAV